MATNEFVLATEADLARARTDHAFRQQLLAQNLDHLLAELNKLRKLNDGGTDPLRAAQIREGVKLAVKLAEILTTLADAPAPDRASVA
ncbi:MAG TPA: hypothetical protein VHA77_03360 [Xanthobacteraceae bacterium]|jgi:hypothetical protein|nr:hypothetical protein [Xanthobacteraceae bacterium]